MHGNLHCVKFLLRQPGVDIHARDRWRASPLSGKNNIKIYLIQSVEQVSVEPAVYRSEVAKQYYDVKLSEWSRVLTLFHYFIIEVEILRVLPRRSAEKGPRHKI